MEDGCYHIRISIAVIVAITASITSIIRIIVVELYNSCDSAQNTLRGRFALIMGICCSRLIIKSFFLPAGIIYQVK